MFSCSCDTMVAMSDVTDDGSIIFGKNSDRQANEPLSSRYVPSSAYPRNSKVKATYIEIDQVEQTHSCVLFSPTNIFGAEMGFNCHGLVVGNEALFTKVPSYEEGLTGMDLVRLVLERCATSREGKNEIVSLLKRYDQGGNCGFSSKFYYHSSFLLVDSREGWLVETVGKEYAAKKITNGIHTISNVISFGGIHTFDEYSENLIEQAIINGWCRSIKDFHFQRCYSGWSFHPQEFYNGVVKTHFACSRIRQIRSKELIERVNTKDNSARFNVLDMFNVLRDHQHSKTNPSDGLTNVDICMHAGFGPIRFNQTTGSLVSVIPTCSSQIPTHYATCTSLPCLSVFKPMWLESSEKPPRFISSVDANVSHAPSTYSSNSIWWKSEVLTRNIMKYYRELIEQIATERDLLEHDLVRESKQLASISRSHEERNRCTISSFIRVDQLTNQWFSRVCSLSSESELSFWQELTWERWRRSAKIPTQFFPNSQREYDEKWIVVICLFVILVLFRMVYFNNSNQWYFVLSFLFFSHLFFGRIRVTRKKTRPQTNITLPILNFND